MNTNNAIISPNEVQGIRTLQRFGFRNTTIARAYGLCSKSIDDIAHGRAWYHLPPIDVPLPLLAPHAAAMLRLRSFKKLSPEQRQSIEQYARRVAEQIEDQAEREPFALALLSDWKPVQPVPHREMDRVSVAHP